MNLRCRHWPFADEADVPWKLEASEFASAMGDEFGFACTVAVIKFDKCNLFHRKVKAILQHQAFIVNNKFKAGNW